MSCSIKEEIAKESPKRSDYKTKSTNIGIHTSNLCAFIVQNSYEVTVLFLH